MQALSPTRLRGLAELQLGRLCAAAQIPPGNSQRLHRIFSILTEGALDRPASPPFEGLSSINRNGLPLQWSVAAGEPVPSVRFLCESGPIGASAESRLARAFRQLEEASRLVGLEDGAAHVESLARKHLIPSEWPAHWRSAMWTAATAAGGKIGLKAYFNLSAGEPVERWRRAGRLLQALGRQASLERLCQYSGIASRDSWPVGIAIGIGKNSRDTGSVKIYFRSGEVSPAWLANWYEATGYTDAAEPVRLLLETFAPPREAAYPKGALVVSLEFPASDEPPAIKTEIEVDRWSANEAATARQVTQFLRRLRIDDAPYQSALAALRCDPNAATMHRLAGVRTDGNGTHRANIYFEPPLEAVRKRTLPRATSDPIQQGVAWLAAHRDPQGGWSDFKLPVGRADRWVTAYVSLAVSHASPELAKAGCAWLDANRGPSGGWGYNATTPADADSTALAVLAFREVHLDPGVDAMDLLRLCQVPQGGFATYPLGTPPGGAWCESVADVTPVASAALDSANADWLLSQQRTDGLWNPYWWTTPLYPASWVARIFGKRLPPASRDRLSRALRGWLPAGAFECALLILGLQALGEPCERWREELLRMQRPDGSWPQGAWLRLSRPVAQQPWRGLDSGPCFPDENAIFTTATAIDALTASWTAKA